jgi:hypothetical protein
LNWNVVDVVDERDGLSIGEIDVTGFNAYSEFTGTLKLSVLSSRQKSEEFRENEYCCLSLSLRDGGSDSSNLGLLFGVVRYLAESCD